MAVRQLIHAEGTPYTVTATPALAAFGTRSPVATLTPGSGNRLINCRVSVQLVGATFAAPVTLTLKLHKNGVDVPNSATSYVVPIVTTSTQTLAVIALPAVVVAKTNVAEVIQLWADLSAAPSAGSVQISEATIIVED